MRSQHTFQKFDGIKLPRSCPKPSHAGVTVVSNCGNALDLNLSSSSFAFRPPIFAGGRLAKCSIILHSHWRNFDGDRAEFTAFCIGIRIWNKRVDTFACWPSVWTRQSSSFDQEMVCGLFRAMSMRGLPLTDRLQSLAPRRAPHTSRVLATPATSCQYHHSTQCTVLISPASDDIFGLHHTLRKAQLLYIAREDLGTAHTAKLAGVRALPHPDVPCYRGIHRGYQRGRKDRRCR